jgi:hypothetical protein
MELFGYHPKSHHPCMAHNKDQKQRDNSSLASITKEMAKPRMARSARIAKAKLDTARIPDAPSATLPEVTVAEDQKN